MRTHVITSLKLICLFAEILTISARQDGFFRRQPQSRHPVKQRSRIRGSGRPSSGYGSGGHVNGGGATGGLGNILNGVDLNLLDAKLIGLGYVREDLVKELCNKATQQLIKEGVQRAQSEAETLVQNLTTSIDSRCEQLVSEGENACSEVIRQVTDRFNTISNDILVEGQKQCENTKTLTVEMVKDGALRTYESQLELGRQLAEAEFRKQVEEQKNRGERMFQEEVEKNRAIAERELRRRVKEGRQIAEKNFTQEVENGKKEAERQYQQTIAEERKKAEETFQKRVAEERAKAEKVFEERVAEGRAEAERQFKEAALKAQDEGEKMCTEMITVACQNVTIGSESDEFCEEFFFFTSELEDGARLKRQNQHLYGSFYQKIRG